MDLRVFYEVIVPLLEMERTSLICISTILESFNFYSRLLDLKDGDGNSLFETLRFELICEACRASDNPEKCTHMLHLVPRWQSADRHKRLKIMMAGEYTAQSVSWVVLPLHVYRVLHACSTNVLCTFHRHDRRRVRLGRTRKQQQWVSTTTHVTQWRRRVDVTRHDVAHRCGRYRTHTKGASVRLHCVDAWSTTRIIKIRICDSNTQPSDILVSRLPGAYSTLDGLSSVGRRVKFHTR